MGISGISSNKKSGQGGDVTDIISKLVAQTQKLNVPDARKDAILQARRLISALETPMETLLRIEWVEVCLTLNWFSTALLINYIWQPTTFTAIRLAIDLKLFETLAAESGRDKTISELCVPKSADPALVIRLVRHLAATGFVCEQTGTGTYTPNAMSKALATPEYSSGIRVWYVWLHILWSGRNLLISLSALIQLLVHMPICLPFLKRLATRTRQGRPMVHFSMPMGQDSKSKSLKAWLPSCVDWGVKISVEEESFPRNNFLPRYLECISWLKWFCSAFAWFNQRPELLKDLNTYLFAQRSERPSWTADGFYPIHEHLVQGMDIKGDRSVLVDVGGGAGFYLEEFRTKVPEWKGRLVLQEQETIVEQIKSMILNPRIECQSYDFFTEQPIKGQYFELHCQYYATLTNFSRRACLLSEGHSPWLAWWSMPWNSDQSQKCHGAWVFQATAQWVRCRWWAASSTTYNHRSHDDGNGSWARAYRITMEKTDFQCWTQGHWNLDSGCGQREHHWNCAVTEHSENDTLFLSVDIVSLRLEFASHS